MKSFKEFSQDKELSEQYTSEALSIAQRLKKSRLFKRIAAKIKLGRKRASKKIITDPKKLFKRAIKQQRMKNRLSSQGLYNNSDSKDNGASIPEFLRLRQNKKDIV